MEYTHHNSQYASNDSSRQSRFTLQDLSERMLGRPNWNSQSTEAGTYNDMRPSAHLMNPH